MSGLDGRTVSRVYGCLRREGCGEVLKRHARRGE